MKAFHNNPELKAGLLRELLKHEAADAAIRGTYGTMGLSAREFKGCAIGCALNSLNLLNGQFCPVPKPVSDHSRFPEELGIPLEIAFLIDHIFENLPDPYHKTFPRRVIEAVPVGADLSKITSLLLNWMILDPINGMISRAEPKLHPAYHRFAELVEWELTTPSPVTTTQWDQIESDLASCKAWTWAWAWTCTGAWTWSWARGWARGWAGAWARGRAGSNVASQTNNYKKLNEKLIELLSAAR